MNLTLNQIKEKSPCKDGWEKLLESLNKTKSDDSAVSIQHLLESNGVDDTLWVILNCIPERFFEKRNMLADIAEAAVAHAEKALPIFEKDYPNDNRPRLAIEESVKCISVIRNSVEAVEAAAAAGAAWAAAGAAWAAWAAGDAAGAARAAAGAAWAAGAARAAAGAAARAAEAAAGAAWAARAAGDAAENEKLERENQKRIILKYFGVL